MPSTHIRRPRSRCTLQVESLESRTVPSTLFVTSIFDPHHGYGTLAVAVAAAKPGDVIQIEPGSAPDGGVLFLNTITIDKHVTIQGDPLRGRANIPVITSPLSIASGVQGVVLSDLNDSGGIFLQAGSKKTTIKNCWLLGGVEESGGIGNFGNVIEDCSFGHSSHLYLDGDSTAATGDQVLRNHFSYALEEGSSSPAIGLDHNSGAVVRGNVLVGNVFGGNSISGGFIQLGDSGAHGCVVIADNTMTVPPVPDPFTMIFELGIALANSDNPAVLEVQILNNVLSIGNGDGVGIFLAGAPLAHVVFKGNDFHGCVTGVFIEGPNPAAGSVIQIGGVGAGIAADPGGNDFRGLLPSGFAITQTFSTLTIPAEGNIWPAHVDFTKVIQDGTRNQGAGTIVTGAQPDLSASAQFVATLYNDFLGRPPSLADVTFWSHLLDTGAATRSRVADAIEHSTEALTRLVDRLYLKFLGRPADATGETVFVKLLKQGLIEEQVIAALAASDEFVKRAGTIENSASDTPNTNFVHALYTLLLGRPGDGPGVDFWVNQLPSQNRGGVVMGFLQSAEFRSRAAASLYFTDPSLPSGSLFDLLPDFLHRPSAPANAEVQKLLGLGLDLLRLEAMLAAGEEFYGNG